MAKIIPQHPFTEEHRQKFDEYLAYWQKRLNLNDWHLIKKGGRTANVAEVFKFEPEHRLVRYRLGRDNGSEPITDEVLEEIAIHELLHVRFNDMIDVAMEESEYGDRIIKEEHAAIIILQKLLLRLRALERQLETMNANKVPNS